MRLRPTSGPLWTPLRPTSEAAPVNSAIASTAQGDEWPTSPVGYAADDSWPEPSWTASAGSSNWISSVTLSDSDEEEEEEEYDEDDEDDDDEGAGYIDHLD